MMIFLVAAHGASSSASGTRVVLPAPGGATSNGGVAARKRDRQLDPAPRRSGEERRSCGANFSSVITREGG